MRKLLNVSQGAIVIFLILFSACSPKVVSPTESDLSRGKAKYPDLSLTELNEGRALYVENCNMCHGYYAPTDEPTEEWYGIVPEMVGKVNKKTGTEKIDAAEQEKILKFVVTMSSASP